ncbi:MAG: Mu transposase C-terminal domain-containing protein, partial [Bacteroidetes bacterium]|nr:Mu transposase C-terminal domain-containing protein [Bacteroidota bacterium]
TRKVDGQRGVKIRHLWFWNDVFTKAELKNREVEVRVDPWDPGTAFALLKGQWVACRSKLQPTLSKYTEVERRYLFEEIAKKMGNRIGTLSAHRLAEWLHVMKPENFDPKLSEQQEQGKAVYRALDMAQAVSDQTRPPSVPSVVVPLKVPKSRSQPKPEAPAKPKVRRGAAPLEVESDDYSLF